MCAALYIVTEREIPGFDTFVSGKALSCAEPQLAAIAAQLGVTPLLEFCSIGSEDASAFLEAEGVDAGDVEFPPAHGSRLMPAWRLLTLWTSMLPVMPTQSPTLPKFD